MNRNGDGRPGRNPLAIRRIGELVADARRVAAQSNEASADALAKLEKLMAARTAARLGVDHAFGQ